MCVCVFSALTAPAFVGSRLDYYIALPAGCPKILLDKPQRVQKSAARLGKSQANFFPHCGM
jgi:hypothetical protein